MSPQDQTSQSVDIAHDILASAAKPWWQSKKILLALLALGIAAYQAYSGKDTASTAEVIHKIATTATFLVPIVGLILSLAHVDAATRSAALDFLGTLKTIDQAADDPARGQIVGAPPAPAGPYDPTKSQPK